MTAVRFPVAKSAEAALSGPLGRAARQREAEALAGGDVAFVSESVGPAFASREALLDAYAGRLDDERGGPQIAPEDRYLNSLEMAAGPLPAKPVRPIYRGGRRWPTPPAPPATVWRLTVRYWRVGGAATPVLAAPEAPSPPSGKRAAARPADPRSLRERLQEPLRPLKPQQPLDTGLFEVRPPEAPHIVMPDE